ncbi:hypothetical protein FGG78_17210 [Thioclava sp. BHET1]|nr:hypothetical protein FGG78_17210 [Thioclava sp. BHET1]
MIALALIPVETRGEAGAWVIREGLTLRRLFPLFGFAIALSLVPRSAARLAFVLWLAGLAVGYMYRIELMAALQQIPGAITHHFLTMPVSAIAAGLVLAPGRMLRPVLIAPAGLILGVMYALATKLSDPSYGGAPWVFLSGCALGVWLIVAVTLSLRAWNAPWFEIAGRIIGSWLLAIGLLYGGVSVMGNRLKPKSEPTKSAISENAPATQSEVPGADAFPSFGAPPAATVPGESKPEFQP